VLTISSPEGDDITIYKVDCKNKKVLSIDHEGFSTEKQGRFTGFFKNIDDYIKN